MTMKKQPTKKKAAAKKKKPATRIESDIAKYGWHAVLVAGDDDGPPFAYTIGFTSTFGHPEVLVYGLNADLKFMHGTLGVIAKAIEGGARFRAGREYGDIVGDYRCKLVAIPKSAYGEYLGTALRHFGNDRFEALQCVWPDHEQRYPWDRDAHPQLLARQPVLAEKKGVTWSFGDVEKYHWVITTKQVASGKKPVREVWHDADDGAWQLLCGTTEDENDAIVVSIGNLVDRDPTLRALGDLPRGWRAVRDSAKGKWRRSRAPAD